MAKRQLRPRKVTHSGPESIAIYTVKKSSKTEMSIFTLLGFEHRNMGLRGSTVKVCSRGVRDLLALG